MQLGAQKTNNDFWEDALKNQPPSYRRWFEADSAYLKKNISKNAKVLDVACGSGRNIFDLITVTQHIVGLDHDAGAVRDTSRAFSDYPSVKIVLAEATDMPFDDQTFDYVICMGSFANFSDKKLIILNEMSRVLSASGRIIISVFSEDAFEERMKLYSAVGAKIKEVRGTTVVFDESLGDNISEQFTSQQLRELFSQANLEVEDMTKMEIAYLCTLRKRGEG